MGVGENVVGPSTGAPGCGPWDCVVFSPVVRGPELTGNWVGARELRRTLLGVGDRVPCLPYSLPWMGSLPLSVPLKARYLRLVATSHSILFTTAGNGAVDVVAVVASFGASAGGTISMASCILLFCCFF